MNKGIKSLSHSLVEVDKFLKMHQFKQTNPRKLEKDKNGDFKNLKLNFVKGKGARSSLKDQ